MWIGPIAMFVIVSTFPHEPSVRTSTSIRPDANDEALGGFARASAASAPSGSAVTLECECAPEYSGAISAAASTALSSKSSSAEVPPAPADCAAAQSQAANALARTSRVQPRYPVFEPAAVNSQYMVCRRGWDRRLPATAADDSAGVDFPPRLGSAAVHCERSAGR